jgi:SAM-dependent methyltransferase
MIDNSARAATAAVNNSLLRWNTPLSEEHAALLVSACAVPEGGRVLDLGCGWGELLVRLVESAPESTGDGVDTDAEALRRGERLVAARGLHERVRLHEQAAVRWSGGGYDVAVCVGSTHAWPNGTPEALRALRSAVASGGRVLLGDGFWAREPTPAAMSALGAAREDMRSLDELVRLAAEVGFRPLQVTVAGEREWDLFESAWCAGGERWMLANPDDPRCAAVRAVVDEHRTGYLAGYRGILGLAYLVLAG